ncbi:hypothetical protein ACEQPO_12910 [Bacillus sp. SL00103]
MAGPVVAADCHIKGRYSPARFNDSKQLSDKKIGIL